MSRIHCALLHHPVRDRAGGTVTTAVTTLDVHDIARSARTYGLAGYYVVTPIEAQHALVQRVLDHWSAGAGLRRMPERGEALTLCRTVSSLQAALADVERRDGNPVRTYATAAAATVGRPTTTFEAARPMLEDTRVSHVILYGTGHGLSTEVLDSADVLIEPVVGAGDYNHLSVRAAAAIVMDRLCGSGPNIDARQTRC